MPLISRRPKVFQERTTGIYGHTPKYWKCQGPEDRYHSESCDKPTRHLSYVGYLGLVTKTHIWFFWYMGGGPRNKVIERIERVTFVSSR